MNGNACNGEEGAKRGFRPSFAIYHPNAKCSGCAIKMELHPAHDDTDGSIMLTLANQKTSARPGAFATFDWERRITVKLDFMDLIKMMQVLRGDSETIEDGKGLYHRNADGSSKINLRHIVEGAGGYLLEVYRNESGKPENDRACRLLLTPAEAYGVKLLFEDSIGVICFGLPKVVPHDVSAYRTKVREQRNAAVA